MPAENQQATIHLRPTELFDLQGVNFEDINIDILGPDIIFADLVNNSKLIFPGLALILFSEEEAPSLMIRGSLITPEMLLSKIGTIQNITQKDFLSFTSLQINPEQGNNENATGLPEVTDEKNDTVDLEILAALQNSEAQKNSQSDNENEEVSNLCLLYTSPSPRDS